MGLSQYCYKYLNLGVVISIVTPRPRALKKAEVVGWGLVVYRELQSGEV